MSAEEFNALISRLIEGVPIGFVISRLAMLTYELVQLGGDPAAELVRLTVRDRTEGE